MKKNKTLLGALAIVLILSSCSVDKRVHMSGYNIKWKNNKNIAVAKQTPVKTSKTIVVEETEIVVSASTENTPLIINKTPQIDFFATPKTKEVVVVAPTKKTVRAKIKEAIKKSIAEGEGKKQGFAIAGFVCSITAILFAGFILGTLGLIFSAVALHRIKNNPEKYKGKKFAIAGLIIGIVAVGLTLIFLALL